jgi:hypothetical protein
LELAAVGTGMSIATTNTHVLAGLAVDGLDAPPDRRDEDAPR